MDLNHARLPIPPYPQAVVVYHTPACLSSFLCGPCMFFPEMVECAKIIVFGKELKQMPVWSIILLCVLGLVIAALIVLTILGKKRQKKQEEQTAEMEKQAQTVSLYIIDMKKLRMKDAGMPKIVVDSTPRLAKLTKMPVLKVKAGNRVMSLICDPEVYKTLLPKQEVKAKVSGVYVLSAKYVRGPKLEGKAKEVRERKKLDRFLDKLR